MEAKGIVAEMPVASCFNRALQAIDLSLPVLISRTAMVRDPYLGGVGGVTARLLPTPMGVICEYHANCGIS